MSRRINTGTIKVLGPAKGAGGNDDFLGRLAKYIPAEIVGLYVAALGLVGDLPLYQKAAFFGCLVLTPVYLRFATHDPGKGPLWLQVLLGSIAFPVWALAIGVPFWSYPPQAASLALLFVTVIFGLIKPRPGT